MARERLTAERREWLREHPVGFTAKPIANADGSVDLFHWRATFPAKAGSPWATGDPKYVVKLDFSTEYPADSPICSFDPPIFHPNIFPCGQVCLSLLDPDKDWTPAITIPQILLGLQELLDTPNLLSPAQQAPAQMLEKTPKKYEEEVKRRARAYAEAAAAPAAAAPVKKK